MCRNGMKRPRSLRSGSRSEVEASSSEGVRHPWVSRVPRWCAKRTLAGLGWPSNTLCRLRRLAGLTALRKTGRPWAQLRKQAADTMRGERARSASCRGEPPCGELESPAGARPLHHSLPYQHLSAHVVRQRARVRRARAGSERAAERDSPTAMEGGPVPGMLRVSARRARASAFRAPANHHPTDTP
jgi:hypothetical protein